MTYILKQIGIELRTHGRNQISLKSAVSNVPTVLSLNNSDAITNPYDISNTFNNFSASIAETTKKKKA